jgi:hypothetical protein
MSMKSGKVVTLTCSRLAELGYRQIPRVSFAKVWGKRALKPGGGTVPHRASVPMQRALPSLKQSYAATMELF